ncbi:2,3-bisphosphoglycerate-independent phosphoglycerate mutase [Desulfonatronovibrio magnus]|uniref:2,3-bisphosphoglycerate-independent phosphoglycerate mutase n=1 Tax=Desulfonatronovibrio magnus TaxID=698827 RepID=UPI0005EBB1AF|nr:2,3-bisphosphoglycerate-independent phosphoglycerate mutase [Desulfonatronovibrio magnus]
MQNSSIRPVLLLILDGWGIAPKGPGNAISQATTPNLDNIFKTFPSNQLRCSGSHVGLPDGQMGNSEVGHLNIGAGRVVYQDIMRINLSIEKNELSQNPELLQLFNSIEAGGRLHLMGLVSDGGVHSLQDHLHSLLDIAVQKGITSIFVHCILDGRDTTPNSGANFVQNLQDHIQKVGSGRIATVAGRYYAMDRDKRWERTEQAYDALTLGSGPTANDPVELIKESYARGETDEFVKPHVLVQSDGTPVATIQDGDGVVFFNFRADRARQMTQALTDSNFQNFNRKKAPDIHMLTMTRYEKDFNLPVLFPPQEMQGILAEAVAEKKLTQLRLAETEKYAHVTYFFNGGTEDPFPGEDRILVPSPREVSTYDQKPEMSVLEVTSILTKKISSKAHNLYICNFANLDMVGHSGSIPATIKACEVVDQCVGKVVQAILEQDGTMLLTADHGNAEDMLTDNGKTKTSHSMNPVPLCFISNNGKTKTLRPEGILADIAPTILDILKIKIPEQMTGKSLLED